MNNSRACSQLALGLFTTLAHGAAPGGQFECYSKELLWLATVILGGKRNVEKCLQDAAQLADSAGYVAPEWLERWTQRALVRTTIDEVRSEVQKIAANYVLQPEEQMKCVPGKTDGTLLRSMDAETIARSCDALERVALILYGYLGYSVQDCALLLACRRSVIEPACSRALKNITDNSHSDSG